MCSVHALGVGGGRVMRLCVEGAGMNVYCLLPPNVLLTDLAGPLDALRYAERFGADLRVRLVSPQTEIDTSFGLQISGVHPLPTQLDADDVVLIPGMLDESLACQSAAGRQIAHWLAQVFEPTQNQILTVCSGIFLPAQAGLLNQVKCTTHHTLLDDLRAFCPSAVVLENRVFVDHGAILSSAGITAGFDLILYWLAQRFGHEVACQTARHMNVYFRRTPQDSALSPWLIGRSHMQVTVHRVQDYISVDPSVHYDLNALAQIACISPRHLTRIFKQTTGMTVHEYQLVLKHALFEQWRASGLSQEKAALSAGFSSANSWRRSKRKA